MNSSTAADLLNISGSTPISSQSIPTPRNDLLGPGSNVNSVVESGGDHDNPLGILGLSVDDAKRHVAKDTHPPKKLPKEEFDTNASTFGSTDDISAEVSKLMELGFSMESARDALESTNYRVEDAVSLLISGRAAESGYTE